MRSLLEFSSWKRIFFRCRQKVSDCVGVESVGSRFFKPVSEVGGRSVSVGSRKKSVAPSADITTYVYSIYCIRVPNF